MLVAALPPTRALIARAPWGSAAGLACALLAVEAALILPGGYVSDHVASWPWTHYATQGLVECLPLFLVGWMLNLMRGWRLTAASLLVAVVAVALAAQLGARPTATVLLGGTIALLAVNLQIPMPARLGRWLQQLATVTLFVYLLHVFVIFVLAKLHLPQSVMVTAAITGSFAAAVLAKRAFDSVDRFVLDLVRQDRARWPQVPTGRGAAALGREP